MGVNDTGETIEQRLGRLRGIYRMDRRCSLPAVDDIILDVEWLMGLVQQNILGEALAVPQRKDAGDVIPVEVEEPLPQPGAWRCYHGHLNSAQAELCYCGLKQPGAHP